jgi:hypothetical protein
MPWSREGAVGARLNGISKLPASSALSAAYPDGLHGRWATLKYLGNLGNVGKGLVSRGFRVGISGHG